MGSGQRAGLQPQEALLKRKSPDWQLLLPAIGASQQGGRAPGGRVAGGRRAVKGRRTLVPLPRRCPPRGPAPTRAQPSHAPRAGPEEHTYALDLSFYGPINKDDTKISKTDRTILLAIAKKEEGFWPRLLEQAGKPAPNIKASCGRALPVQAAGAARAEPAAERVHSCTRSQQLLAGTRQGRRVS